MKKSNSIFAIVAMAIVAIVIVVVSCKKDNENTEKQSNCYTYPSFGMRNTDEMSTYLKQFKEKMQSSTKSDETLSLEDARWHLEAVLNYSYGDAGHKTSDIQCDTFQCKIQTNGGLVKLSDLNKVFNLISNEVEQVYANCPLPDKSILAIQTILINEREDNYATLQSIVNTRGLNPVPAHWYVDSTDYWYEDDYSGKCGPYEGTCGGVGAVQIIQNKITTNAPFISCIASTGYFTDYEEIAFYDYDVIEMPDVNSPHGYRIPFIRCTYCDPPICFSPEEINYYIVEGLKLINEYSPEGKSFVSMTNVYSLAVPIGYHQAYHRYTFKYGIYHCDGNGSVD